MSDLISRSELLKRFLVNKDGHRIPERDCDNLEVTVSIKDVKTIIKDQPTAYDIDKVVEQIKSAKDEDHMVCYINDKPVIEKQKAIEIVKQGGVSDDVCEWQSDCHLENNNPAEWLINPHKPKKIFSTDIKYCPYCGKKIKVVEWLKEARHCMEENRKAGYNHGFTDGFNKAVDDFVENISLEISGSLIWGMLVDCFKYKNMNDTSDKIVDYVINTTNEIAEQLKAGASNGTDNQ